MSGVLDRMSELFELSRLMIGFARLCGDGGSFIHVGTDTFRSGRGTSGLFERGEPLLLAAPIVRESKNPQGRSNRYKPETLSCHYQRTGLVAGRARTSGISHESINNHSN